MRRLPAQDEPLKGSKEAGDPPRDNVRLAHGKCSEIIDSQEQKEPLSMWSISERSESSQVDTDFPLIS